MENIRKRKRSPDPTDEWRNRRASSSVETGTDPDAQSATVQEPSTSVEDQHPTVDTAEEFECPICLGAAKRKGNIKHLRCSHEFHQSCIDKWLHNNRSCPLCRAPVPRSRPRRFDRYRRRFQFR
ncbi:hypothetical protein AVEN_50283-1 [Araneus ventricosus]|uniref:RING-type E3 ubiquitin transferase n=1 Tax=Araneus ventricosus TaxID=182803 RepID=A0A4Y2G716_ARAVE|nr:hypothetical protein AVEN_50283-1 [Araneus ventricosus]